MKLSRITRLLELIGRLQTGSGQNAHSLAVDLEVTRRTIFRDLDVLKRAGVPLRYDEEGQRYLIPSQYYLPPTNFTPQEALSLLVLCRGLGEREGLPFHQPARRAAMKLEGSLPAQLRKYVREATGAVRVRLEPVHPLRGVEATYQELLSAIARRQCVRIRYGSLTEREEIGTKLSPYQLLFSRRSWYVIGRSSLHRATRTFHLGRIRRLTVLEERFRIPRGFSIDRVLRNAWHLIPETGADEHVVVRFEPRVAQNVAEVAWHKTQRLVWRKDGRLDFHVTVSGLHEISWWILGYGDQAEVIRPEALRGLVERHARNMLERYAARGAAKGTGRNGRVELVPKTPGKRATERRS